MYQELLQEYAYLYGLESTPDDYYKSLEKYFPATEEDLLNGYLVERLRSVYMFLGLRSKIKNEMQANRDTAVLEKIAGSVRNDFMRQMVLTDVVVRNYFEQGKVAVYSDNQAFFDEHISVPFLRRFIHHEYAGTERNLSMNPEKISSEILQRLESTSAASVMKMILEAHRGSVVYIDCWATWCGPCLAAMREAEPFVKQLKKDVAFVYLCLESEKDTWKRLSKVMNIGENNYFLTAGQSSVMRTAFEIQGIPFYVLIDKNGTIVDKGSDLRIYDNAVFSRIAELAKR